MSRSRWGGFRIGRRVLSEWYNRVSPSAISVEQPTTIQEFDYTTSQGIWTLNATTQFYKKGVYNTTYPIGFSDSLDSVTGINDAWSQRTVDISAYAGATVYLVFNYTNGASFRGDIQLDAINLDGTTYSFENTGESFQTSAAGESTYAGVSWSSLATGTTAAKWNVGAGGTPSGGTGRTDAAAGSYYVYAETSAPANVTGYNFWLRSPQVTLSGSPTLTYYEARNGEGIGTLNVYLDVIS